MARTFLLFIAILGCCTQSFLQPFSLTKTQWLEDFDFLIRKLEKSAQALYGEIPASFSSHSDQLHAKIRDMEPVAVMAAMSRLTASLNDGHTELDLSHPSAGFRKIPLVLQYFGEVLYVLAASETHSSLVSKKVIKIGGVPVNEVFNKVTPLLARDNEAEWYYAAPNIFILPGLLHFLEIGEDPTQLSLEFEGGQSSVLAAVSPEEYQKLTWVNGRRLAGVTPPLYLKNTAQYYWYEYLPESRTIYFQFNQVKNEKGRPSIKHFLTEMFEEIDRLKPEKMVIDLRWNNGGNYNLSRPLINELSKRPWLAQKGKIFGITGRRTFSAAMVTSVFLKKEVNAILAGEVCRSKPNGADNNEYAVLPNSKLQLSYTTRIKDHWPELGKTLYLEVDLPLENTMEDYLQGKDRVLEQILNFGGTR